MPEAFDPADPASWLSRGRTPEHAAAIAGAWRDFPDLPSDAPLERRMARGRERIAAMRPINDALRDHVEAERQATNFAFTEDQVRAGKGNDRDIAVLRGRDQYGYEWDVACRYADGWYAAHAGWPHHYPDGIPSQAPLKARRDAYDQGFTDGGGDRTDLFDAARRSNLKLLRESNGPTPTHARLSGRPLPSEWPKPSDEPRPARWSRRLAIISADDIGEPGSAREGWDLLRLIRARPGATEMTVLVLTPAGFVPADAYTTVNGCWETSLPQAQIAAMQLSDALHSREFDDVLVALQDDALALLDTIAHVLPLCRTMERTRNTKLQQRTHLRTWLDRGYGSDENVAAGHIRWSKAIKGLSGKLGEFTASHAGAAASGGHLIRVFDASGNLAAGYATAEGTTLHPEVIVSSKAKLRSEIAVTLRAFAAATALMGTMPLLAAD